MQTSTHDLTFADVEVHKRFVQWDRGEAEREWACLSVLAEHAPGLAPRPLRREELDEAPVVVMQCLAGEPLGGAALTKEQTSALGAALSRLYSVPVAAVRAAGIGEVRGAPTRLPVLVELFAGDHDLVPCIDADLVARAIDRARAWLGAPDLPEPRSTVLGIGDLNPANALWDGQVVRLVDFEDGGLSEPAYELACHLEHLGGRGVYDADALIDAVGLNGEERGRLAAYRPLWAAFWLALLMPGTGAWHRNPPGTTEAQAAHFMGLVADL